MVIVMYFFIELSLINLKAFFPFSAKLNILLLAFFKEYLASN